MTQMYAFHAECPELGCMDVVAKDRAQAKLMIDAYLTLHNATDVQYQLGNAMELFILLELGRTKVGRLTEADQPGFAVYDGEDGWDILTVWEYPFSRGAE